MLMKTFTITGTVWRYPHPTKPQSGWYFVNVEKTLSEKIKKAAAGRAKVGFHFVPIKAKLGKTEWQTTFFPTKEGHYIISIKASVRRAEGVDEGDAVKVSCAIL